MAKVMIIPGWLPRAPFALVLVPRRKWREASELSLMEDPSKMNGRTKHSANHHALVGTQLFVEWVSP